METKLMFAPNNNGAQRTVRDALNTIASAINHLDAPAQRFVDDDEGREVLLEDAEQCFAFYKSEMMKRGVLNNDIPITLPVCTDERLQITDAVKFDGFKLKTWIIDTYGSAAGINFKIQFGMYTEAFLLKYYPDDPAERARRYKRITLFIAPYLKAQFVGFRSDAKAYNLGGLEP